MAKKGKDVLETQGTVISKSNYKIVVDTREQKPWEFEEQPKKSGRPTLLGSVVGTLDAGDYSILGLEDIVRIERKQHIAELFCNYTPKEHKERFEREMEKLAGFPFKCIFIETLPTHECFNMSIPQFFKSPPSKVVLRWLNDIEIKYGVPFKFVGAHGAKLAQYYFESVIKVVA